MPNENDINTAIINLLKGNPPGNSEIIKEMTSGISFLTDFWREKYLAEYIKQGGSKIKFLTGSSGSGKSHCLELFLCQAKDDDFITVTLDAKSTRIDNFKDVYSAIYNCISFPMLLEKCAEKIIFELGFNSAEIPDEMNFTDFLASEGLLDPLTKREIRLQLSTMFAKNPLIDNNFALCCSLLTGGLLGHPILEEHNRDLLFSWLSGSNENKISDFKKLGLSPGRITKHNSRHMLRSLIEVGKLAGYSGLLVGVDNLEALIVNSGLDIIRYTKQRREDAYESIRELIDEIDTLHNVMFIFSFDTKLTEDENSGLKSYQALWMRIQNEIEGERFNRFNDMANLDKLASQEYDSEIIQNISRSLADVINGYYHGKKAAVVPLDVESIRMFAKQQGFSSVPRKVSSMTLGGIPLEQT